MYLINELLSARFLFISSQSTLFLIKAVFYAGWHKLLQIYSKLYRLDKYYNLLDLIFKAQTTVLQ